MAFASSSVARGAGLVNPLSSCAQRQCVPFRHAALSRSRRSGPPCVAAAPRDAPESSTDRRSLLLGLAAGMGLVLSPAASADDAEEKIKEVLRGSRVIAACSYAATLRPSAAICCIVSTGSHPRIASYKSCVLTVAGHQGEGGGDQEGGRGGRYNAWSPTAVSKS